MPIRRPDHFGTPVSKVEDQCVDDEVHRLQVDNRATNHKVGEMKLQLGRIEELLLKQAQGMHQNSSTIGSTPQSHEISSQVAEQSHSEISRIVEDLRSSVGLQELSAAVISSQLDPVPPNPMHIYSYASALDEKQPETPHTQGNGNRYAVTFLQNNNAIIDHVLV